MYLINSKNTSNIEIFAFLLIILSYFGATTISHTSSIYQHRTVLNVQTEVFIHTQTHTYLHDREPFLCIYVSVISCDGTVSFVYVMSMLEFVFFKEMLEFVYEI